MGRWLGATKDTMGELENSLPSKGKRGPRYKRYMGFQQGSTWKMEVGHASAKQQVMVQDIGFQVWWMEINGGRY